jgi:hypothetical protein
VDAQTRVEPSARWHQRAESSWLGKLADMTISARRGLIYPEEDSHNLTITSSLDSWRDVTIQQ